ncbi:MAG: S66 peptidase family protein [Bacilli bacterium]
MIYPKFIKEQGTIGVTAPSRGITNELDLKRLDNAKKQLKEKGFNVIETENVRTDNLGRSSSGKERAKQLESLFLDKKVDAIISASGGDFLMEMLPYLDYEVIKTSPKWFQGYSDPTWLTYTITTNLDIATIYSNNFKSFGMNPWHKSLETNIEILKGNLVNQKSFEKYELVRKKQETGLEDYNLTEKVKWKIITGEKEVTLKGRMIGGCLDVINEIYGTSYDKTKEFIEKYKNDGIIWYLENFSLTSEDLTRVLWKLNDKGYFKYTTGIIFGRSLNYQSFYNLSFEETIKSSLKDLNVPIITDADFGHLSPRITIINGAIAEIKVKNSKGEISFILE